MRSELVVVALLVGLAPAAVAQSPREEAYVQGLLARLDRDGLEGAGDARSIRVDVDPQGVVLGEYPLAGGPEANPMQAVAAQGLGLAVDLGDGVELKRLQFDSPEDAQRYLSQLQARDLGAPVFAQVRGDQVVLVTGEAIKDPAFARLLSESVWDGLPAPAEVDAGLTDLGRGQRVLTTRLRDGPVYDRIAELYEKARRVARNPIFHGTGVYMEGDNGLMIDYSPGHEAHLRVDDTGVSFWSTTTAENEATMQAHFDAQGAHPAVRGLRGALAGIGR